MMKWGGSVRILRITFSNLRKKKGAAISLGILILLASLLMNTSLNLMMNARSVMLDRIEALHGPHFVMIFSGNKYMPEYKTFFEEHPQVLESEVESVVALDSAKTEFGNGEMELGAVFYNTQEERSMLPFQAMEQAEQLPPDAVYLPVGMKDGSPKIGEAFPVVYKNKTYTFHVAGYFETTVYGTANTGIVKYYLSDEAFQKFSNEIGVSKALSARFENPLEAEAIAEEFKVFTDGELHDDLISSVSQIGYEQMHYVGTVMPNMFSAGLMGVALLLLLVSALVAKFRISAYIDDNIHNIGVLEALGYTSNQIMLATLAEFIILAFAGAAAGVLLASAVMRPLGMMLIGVSGIAWNGKAELPANLVSILFLLLFTIVVTAADALKIRRLTPVVALRGGLKTHNFKKNRFMLEKPGKLTLQLAGKYAALNPRQNILLGMVMSGVAFIMILAVLLYMNLVKDQTSLIRMCGVELSDIVVHLTKHTDAEVLKEELLQRKGVRKLTMADIVITEVEGKDTIMTTVSDDFGNMETMNVYKGKFPVYDSEAVITGVMAEGMGKDIGDTVTISYRGVSADYMITGFTQSTNLGGLLCFITLDGIKRLDPYYMQESISVYLEEETVPDIFMEELERDFCMLPFDGAEATDIVGGLQKSRIQEKIENLMSMYGTDSLQYAMMKDGKIILSGNTENYKIERLENYRLKIQAQLYSMGQMFTALTQLIIIFSVFIISLILNMLIRAMIRKWQKEFGIQKSLGYTSGQLTFQIVGSIFPAALVGTVFGGMLGSFFAKSVFSVIFYNVGISNMLLDSSFLLYFLVCLGVLAAALLCAFLSARQTRKISVYKLMAE